MKRKIFFVLFLLAFTMGAFSGAYAEAEEEYFYYSYVNPLYADVITEADLLPLQESPVSMHADTYLSMDEAVIQLREELKNRNTVFSISYLLPIDSGVTVKESLGKILYRALEHTGNATEGDYLSFQYGGYNSKCSYYTEDGYYSVSADYTITFYTDASQETIVDAQATAVLQSLNLDEKNDYEKAMAIYTYVTSHVTYDDANLNVDSYKLKYTAYAALVNGTAVCQGYSNLMYRLNLMAGIDTRIIGCFLDNFKHSWNILQMSDQKYYLVDSTWDAGSNPGNFAYFLCGIPEFESNEQSLEHYSRENWVLRPYETQMTLDYAVSDSHFDMGKTERLLRAKTDLLAYAAPLWGQPGGEVYTDVSSMVVDFSPYVKAVTGNVTGVSFEGYTLVIGEPLSMRFVFRLDESPNEYEFLCTRSSELKQNGDYWYVEISGIMPEELANVITVDVKRNDEIITISASPLSYAESASMQEDTTYQNVAKALYNYYETALNE